MTDTIPYERYVDGVMVDSGTVEVPVTPQEIERRAVVTEWKARRAALVSANQTLQAASTTAQVTAAMKAYATANNQAFAVVERTVRWLDSQLADLQAEG